MFRERRQMLIFGVIFVLFGTILTTEATQLSDHTKNKRQVTYMEKVNDSKEDAADTDRDFHHPVTKRPLPSHLAYPGDLSRFFTSAQSTEIPKDDSKNITSNTTAVSSSTDERTLKRKKRGGGYILEKKQKGDSVLDYGFRNEPLLYSASTLAEFAQGKNSNKGIPSEMSFDGAGFLRIDEDLGLELDSFQPTGSGRNSYGLPLSNSRDVNDFNRAFNPSTPRKLTPYENDVKHSQGSRALIKMTLEKKIIPKGSEMVKIIDRLRNGNILGSHPTDSAPKGHTAVKLIRQSHRIGGNQPFLQNRPQNFFDHSTAQLPQKIEESFINYHSVLPFQIQPKTPLSRFKFSYPNRLLGRKVFRRKRSTSTHLTTSPAPVKKSKDLAFEGASQESRKNYRMEHQKDQEVSDSGYIPLTGSYDGGVIHLSLPYYGSGGPQPPSYGPPSTVHVIHAYPPPPPSGPQSRHYGTSGPADQHFFHPSEARRFSYGVLGSGNFEVIRGGIFPDDEPTHGRHAGGGRGYPGGRVPFEGGSYTTYGGTTEIIFDGPIQGFQGFDNFPAHLINALSKHGDVTVHVPPERRDESQLIPVTYPLQAVS